MNRAQFSAFVWRLVAVVTLVLLALVAWTTVSVNRRAGRIANVVECQQVEVARMRTMLETALEALASEDVAVQAAALARIQELLATPLPSPGHPCPLTTSTTAPAEEDR